MDVPSLDFLPQIVARSGVKGSSKRPGRPIIDGIVRMAKEIAAESRLSGGFLAALCKAPSHLPNHGQGR